MTARNSANLAIYLALVVIGPLLTACREGGGDRPASAVRQDSQPRVEGETTSLAGRPEAASAEGARIDWSDFGLILSRVTSDGWVDRQSLRSSQPLIARMLSRLNSKGPASQPENFSSPSSRAAYYINAANLMMLAELASAVQSDRATRWRMSKSAAMQIQIDGRKETTFSLQEKAIGAIPGDWRIRFSLFSGRADGPLLWHRILLPDMLDVQLDEIVRAAMKSPRVVRPDFGVLKRLLVCRELFDIRERLVADYNTRLHTTDATLLNVILEWLDDFDRQSLNATVGYPVEQLPEDWRLPPPSQ